jgi:LCP family protein required for cell wall assembly
MAGRPACLGRGTVRTIRVKVVEAVKDDMPQPSTGPMAAAESTPGEDEADASQSAADESAAPASDGDEPVANRKRRKSRKLKILVVAVAATVAAVAIAIGVTATAVVAHLNNNIKHTLLLPNGVTQAPEVPDAFGHTAMNILIIGSDTRSGAANCALGHGCDESTGYGNADVEMLAHLSADRSNATVMSIPRDTVTALPSCAGGGTGMINSALSAGGPACQVATIHELTGLTIDHYAMMTFSGVVDMSNVLGGVPVCVSNTMYDHYSGLRLNAGYTTVQGVQALQFLRTRYGFGDGSDLGRESAQHYFLSSMIRQIRANLNLAGFSTLYGLADAATKALTVDDGLGGVTNLMSLAGTLNKVPTDRVTFVTMPYAADPRDSNRVIPADSAAQMFANIKNDVPYSAATSTDAAAGASAASASASTAASLASAEASYASALAAYNSQQAAAGKPAVGSTFTPTVASPTTPVRSPVAPTTTSSTAVATAPSVSSPLNAAATGGCIQVNSDDVLQ